MRLHDVSDERRRAGRGCGSRAPRHTSRRFSRAAIAGKDARTLARELPAMTQEEFSAVFRNSPMKRAKLRTSTRTESIVLGTVGSGVDVDVLTRALDGAEPPVREHAARAIAQLRR